MPKLLGTYEIELHDIVDEIIAKKPDVIFNIGAAEGYYSIGLARSLPSTRVVAWETTENGRALSRTLAKLNGVETNKLQSHGLCTVSALKRRLEEYTQKESIFLIVDIEGGEALLLDPEIIPRLSQTEMLIEIHECFIPGVQQILVDRFSTTHSILEIKARWRSPADWPKKLAICNKGVWNGSKAALMNEHRPSGMSWLYHRTL